MAEPIYRGRDYTVSATGVQNSVSGAYFTGSATGTWTLYDSAGTSVATGGLTYTSASSGDFTAAIENSTTATLSVGAWYTIRLSLSEGGADWTDSFTVPVQDPGEILIDAEIWLAYTGNSVTAAERAVASRWCAAVRKAILRLLRPFVPEPQSVTFYLDAPPRNALIANVRPIRSITSLRLHPRAFGLEANFSSADELTEGVGWYMEKDPLDGFNRSGLIYLTNRSVWSYSTRREVGRLAPTIDPDRGAIRIVAEVGEPTVPDDIRAAAVQAVTKAMKSRRLGAQPVSASLNGATYSLPSEAVAAGILRDSTIMSYLAPYVTTHVA